MWQSRMLPIGWEGGRWSIVVTPKGRSGKKKNKTTLCHHSKWGHGSSVRTAVVYEPHLYIAEENLVDYIMWLYLYNNSIMTFSILVLFLNFIIFILRLLVWFWTESWSWFIGIWTASWWFYYRTHLTPFWENYRDTKSSPIVQRCFWVIIHTSCWPSLATYFAGVLKPVSPQCREGEVL